MKLERISIEVTNQCAKACSFCYNHSRPEGETCWQPGELISFVRDCAANGIRALSFGGGEPLQYPFLFGVLKELQGTLFRSITSNGLLLDEKTLDRLVESSPDKVHLSIHFPDRDSEVSRVIRQVKELQSRGIRSGANLLVSRSNCNVAKIAATKLREAGIGNDRIVYLPMRGRDTPSPAIVAEVAGGDRFQSMSCLTRCARSERFCSIGWDKTVAWCSYTVTRAALPSLTFAGLTSALKSLALQFCGGTDDA